MSRFLIALLVLAFVAVLPTRRMTTTSRKIRRP